MRHALFALALLPIAACARVADVDDDDSAVAETVAPEILDLCEDVWAPMECGPGSCAETPVEEAYESGIQQYLDGRTGSAAAVASALELRTLAVEEAEQTSYSEFVWQVDVDWVRLVGSRYVSGGGLPEPDEVEAQLDQYPWLPRVDLDATWISYGDVITAIEDCEAELGVTFDRNGLCSPWFPTDPGDDGIAPAFNLWSPDGASLRIDLAGAEAPFCRFESPVGR